MGNRVLLTCPSRGRPELLKEMLESFRETHSPGTDLVIYLDNDDPRLNEYDNNNMVYIGQRMHVAQIHNHLVNAHPGYDFYMPVNDDITFKTKGWDRILSDTINNKGNGWGIAYGDDSTGNASSNKFNLPIPSFGMISSNIIKTLGHMYPLELKMMFGDTFLLDLGRAIGKLFYCPEVILKHTPPGYVLNDHREGSHFYKTEQLAYAQYIDNNLDNDISKIFDAIIESQKVLI